MSLFAFCIFNQRDSSIVDIDYLNLVYLENTW